LISEPATREFGLHLRRADIDAEHLAPAVATAMITATETMRPLWRTFA
jgi:hypothetical protein